MSEDTGRSSPCANSASSPKIGRLIIIAAPSGAGKTSLVRGLLADKSLGLSLSVSTTTRPPRPGEAHGREYFFTSEADFLSRKAQGEFLEWALVHGNYYGTPRAPVEAVLAQGRDCLFDIDYQGTRQVREKMGADTVSVFILPPSMTELRSRLERRAEDPRDAIERRLENARKEIARWKEYDYVIVNDDLQRAFDDLIAILRAERERRPRRERGLEEFVAKLLSE